MILFWKISENLNEIQLKKDKKDWNNRKMIHPPQARDC